MADGSQMGNTTDVISTDDLGTVKVQRVKIQYGGDGSATDVDSGTPLPVVLSSVKAEDVASANADPGVPILGVRNDSAAARTGSDGDYGWLALDSAGRVGVTDLGGSITVDGTVALSAPADQASTLTDGRKAVSTPGTAVAIRASLACKWVTVTALATNTNVVAVGGSGALATLGSEAGTVLAAGGVITIPVSNANLVFVDARAANEGVSFTVGA